jgi:ribonucleoside-diphosphate reductase alpha chain
MYKTYNFAKRHRALGLGVMGWHSLLQQKMIPFESFEAQQLNTSIFKYLKENSYKASIEIGDKYGHAPIFDEVETSDIKRRNTTLLALAPTTSSSSILGQVSPSVEPYASNYFVAGLAKGSFTRKNLQLENLLINKNKNTEDVWKSIIQNQGSVQHLDFLTDREKEVFKTFQEISPFTIIQQASARQYFIDQGQSINLKIPNAMSIRDVNKVHMEAWKLGLKGLYYQRGTSVAKEAVLSMMECKSCEA